MDDLISRQDAIDALNDEITITGKTNAVVVKDYAQRVKRKLEQLPSKEPDAFTKWELSVADSYRKQPERKTGRWILTGHLWECDKCGCRINRANPLEGNIWNYNYCPNCGAKMEVEHETD